MKSLEIHYDLLLFSEERRLFSNFVQKLFQNFNNCNYDQNSS